MSSEFEGFSDEALVDKTLNEELEAFSELVLRYEVKIRSFCFYMLGDKELSWDISQETFLKAYKNLRTFKKESKFSTWLFSIAKNTSLDALRKSSSKKFLSLEKLSLKDLKGKENFETSSYSLANKLEAKDLVCKVLNKLSLEQKTLLILKDQQGVSIKEIAKMYSTTENSIKSKIKRARAKAKDVLGDMK